MTQRRSSSGSGGFLQRDLDASPLISSQMGLGAKNFRFAACRAPLPVQRERLTQQSLGVPVLAAARRARKRVSPNSKRI